MVYFEGLRFLANIAYAHAMADTPKQADANQIAARVVAESTQDDRLPADVEARWEAWIAGVGRVDDRARALLRAAFEVGVEAGQQKP